MTVKVTVTLAPTLSENYQAGAIIVIPAVSF